MIEEYVILRVEEMVSVLENLGEIELIVAREYNATPADDLPIELPTGSTVDLASIALDLTGTLRATNIDLTAPATGDGVGSVNASVGAVTFVAQVLEGVDRGKELVYNGIERVFVDESAAPLPEGGIIELATLGINLGDDKDGILLMAAVNWSVTFDFVPVVDFAIIQPHIANITFELLRDSEVIYRITQSATQSIVPLARTGQRVTSTTYELVALLYFDPAACAPVGFNTYVGCG